MRRSLLTMLAIALVGASASTAASLPAVAAPSDTAVGTYYPITGNQRVLDTRTSVGGHKGVLGPKSELALQLGGVSGVPAGAAASAVVLNLTAVSPTSNTYLTAYPSGSTRPTVSSLNVAAKQVRANLVTVPVGTDGKIRIYNHTGSVNVVVDLMGFYAKSDIQGTHGVGSMFETVQPGRMFDSRTDPNFSGGIAPGDGVLLGLDFGTTDNANVRGYVVNITAITPSGSGFLTAWDGTDPMPTASSVNYSKNQIVPNMAFVPSQADESDPSGTSIFAVVNGSRSARTHVAVDVVGVMAANQLEGYRFEPLTPTRIIDTRSGLGGPKAPLGPTPQSRTYSAPASTTSGATYFLVGNGTAISPTTATFLTLWESGEPRPEVSNINVAKSEVAANAAVVPLSEDFRFDVFNRNGSVNFALDVAGRFNAYSVPAPAGAKAYPSMAVPSSMDDTGRVHVTPRP